MSAKKKILLIDDDDSLREALREQFELHDDFETAQASTGQDGLEAAKEVDPDLIILDVGLPDFDGREVCKMMRKNNVKCPIIMLTGADTEADTILGLDSGANDYVTKPFNPRELLARIKAVLRRAQSLPPGRETPASGQCASAQCRRAESRHRRTQRQRRASRR